MKTLLKNHGVEFVELSNGTILASNCDGTGTYTNVTNFTEKQTLLFLGY